MPDWYIYIYIYIYICMLEVTQYIVLKWISGKEQVSHCDIRTLAHSKLQYSVSRYTALTQAETEPVKLKPVFCVFLVVV